MKFIIVSILILLSCNQKNTAIDENEVISNILKSSKKNQEHLILITNKDNLCFGCKVNSINKLLDCYKNNVNVITDFDTYENMEVSNSKIVIDSLNQLTNYSYLKSYNHLLLIYKNNELISKIELNANDYELKIDSICSNL